MSALQTSASTPMPPRQGWPPPLLPSTARNAAQSEADASLNLGADEDEQVWTGESVGLGFGLLTKGRASIDAVNWDCRIWSVHLPHPHTLGRCADDVCLCVSLLLSTVHVLHNVPRLCAISEKTASDPCVTRCGHLFCWSHLREVCCSLAVLARTLMIRAPAFLSCLAPDCIVCLICHMSDM